MPNCSLIVLSQYYITREVGAEQRKVVHPFQCYNCRVRRHFATRTAVRAVSLQCESTQSAREGGVRRRGTAGRSTQRRAWLGLPKRPSTRLTFPEHDGRPGDSEPAAAHHGG